MERRSPRGHYGDATHRRRTAPDANWPGSIGYCRRGGRARWVRGMMWENNGSCGGGEEVGRRGSRLRTDVVALSAVAGQEVSCPPASTLTQPHEVLHGDQVATMQAAVYRDREEGWAKCRTQNNAGSGGAKAQEKSKEWGSRPKI